MKKVDVVSFEEGQSIYDICVENNVVPEKITNACNIVMEELFAVIHPMSSKECLFIFMALAEELKNILQKGVVPVPGCGEA